jgi:hypothetical protein
VVITLETVLAGTAIVVVGWTSLVVKVEHRDLRSALITSIREIAVPSVTAGVIYTLLPGQGTREAALVVLVTFIVISIAFAARRGTVRRRQGRRGEPGHDGL